MSFLTSLYRYIPIPLQQAAISWEGRRLARLRYAPDFFNLLAQYEARIHWSPEQIAEFRNVRLLQFLSKVVGNCPFYTDRFRQAGIDPRSVSSVENLAKLPILSKTSVREKPEALYLGNLSKSKIVWSHTSGTTGAGLQFPVTVDAHREQWAVWWRYRRWHGIELNTPCLYFGGRQIVPLSQMRPPYWRYNPAAYQVLFSGYHLSASTARQYLGEMEKYDRPWLHGYPSLLSLLASFALSEGRKIQAAWVTVGAESLTIQQSSLIKEAFGCQPRQHYGMAEGVANISECPLGSLHVDEDYSAVEFVPADGGMHRVIGTNFSNLAFPLIRYDVGDLVQLADRPCTCGRPGRVIERIDGRIEDYVLTKSGRYLGRLDHIFKDMTRIREAQLLQERPGEVRVVVVRGTGYSESDADALKNELKYFLGNEVDFEIAYVDRLPRTASGKLRFVVSTLKEKDQVA